MGARPIGTTGPTVSAPIQTIGRTAIAYDDLGKHAHGRSMGPSAGCVMSSAPTTFDLKRLQQNLEAVRARIIRAAERVGRDPDSITLVAVTKTVGADVARALVELGVHDLGENRPQELWRKAELVNSSVRWHQIGHLQRNKVKRTLPIARLIHSVDSVRLAREIDKHARALGRPADVLLQVNMSREPQKHGLDPDTVLDAVAQIAEFDYVRVHGLMTMAALSEDVEQARPTFRALAALADRLRDQVPSHWPFNQLSMGMSNDFEVAIEEGATMVRVGTALFEGIHVTGSDER